MNEPKVQSIVWHLKKDSTPISQDDLPRLWQLWDNLFIPNVTKNMPNTISKNVFNFCSSWKLTNWVILFLFFELKYRRNISRRKQQNEIATVTESEKRENPTHYQKIITGIKVVKFSLRNPVELVPGHKKKLFHESAAFTKNEDWERIFIWKPQMRYSYYGFKSWNGFFQTQADIF